MNPRKPIQICAAPVALGEAVVNCLIVLCDDGTIAQYSPRRGVPWTVFPEIPGGNLAAIDPRGISPVMADDCACEYIPGDEPECPAHGSKGKPA